MVFFVDIHEGFSGHLKQIKHNDATLNTDRATHHPMWPHRDAGELVFFLFLF